MVNGSGNGVRSGAQTLTLLAAPINFLVLQALEEGPQPQAELRRVAGSPAQTTLRAQLNRLVEIGAILKHRRDRFPGVLEYELTPAGQELVLVAKAIERWLANSPEGPLTPGTSAAKAPIKALAEGWTTAIVRALAAGPHSLTELNQIIGSLNYPAIERRLAAMRLAGQIKARPGNGRGTPYAVTDWLRQGMAPLAAAARWERRHLPKETTPISRVDVEAGFLLAVPLLRLTTDIIGSCRLGVEITNGKGHGLAGVLVEIDRGRIVSCTTRLDGHPDTWILGPSTAWFSALIENDTDNLEIGGDGHLGRALTDGLHRALFRIRTHA